MEYLNNNGSYNKTFWTNGDKITSDKLNKLEDAVYEISDKYATAAYVNAAIGDVNDTKADRDHAHDEYLTEHQSLDGYALKADIPSTEGLATEQFVQDAIDNLELDGGNIDLTGYATEEYVNNTIGDINAILDAINGEVIPDEPEIPLYVPGQFQWNNDITEVTTMVTSEHDNLEYMFSMCYSLQTINGIEYWDTSEVTNMESMFEACHSLESLDLNNFNTSKVTTMSNMFSQCIALTALDLSNFDMSNVESTMHMFLGCDNLQTLHLDNCSADTIMKIFTSEGFPSGKVNNKYREVYVNMEAAQDLQTLGVNLVDGWRNRLVEVE